MLHGLKVFQGHQYSKDFRTTRVSLFQRLLWDKDFDATSYCSTATAMQRGFNDIRISMQHWFQCYEGFNAIGDPMLQVRQCYTGFSSARTLMQRGFQRNKVPGLPILSSFNCQATAAILCSSIFRAIVLAGIGPHHIDHYLIGAYGPA